MKKGESFVHSRSYIGRLMMSLFFLNEKNIQFTDIYYGISWFSTIVSIILLTVGLWNASMLPSEKGFYAFAFILALFGAVAVQKNTRYTYVYERSHSSVERSE